MKHTLRSSGALTAVWLGAACASSAPAPPAGSAAAPAPFDLVSQAIDAAQADRLEPFLCEAVASVEDFFGEPFPQPFRITIFPNRGALDASLPPEWGLAKTECWMVATGVADGMRLLSPRVWKQEACEHDPEDEIHVRRLLVHELVHVYHGQHNPSRDFVDVTGIDWFVEGLATLAAGQLEDPSRPGAREALDRGAGLAHSRKPGPALTVMASAVPWWLTSSTTSAARAFPRCSGRPRTRSYSP